MGLLRIILYIILIYYLFKVIGRLLFPFVIRKGMEQMEKHQKTYDNSTESVKEGEIIIEKKPREPSEEKQDNGEYIDYEEIE
jgi:hypothetical protein